MDSLYTYNNYRNLLRDLVEERKAALGKAYSFAHMAARMKIQRTYLSTVINERAHLNADQLFAGLQFLNLDEEECRFAELLHQKETSANQQRRSLLSKRIDELRNKHLKAKDYVRSSKVVDTQDHGLTPVFLNPDAQLIHVFLTIEKFRRDPEKIRGQLQMSEDNFRQALGILINARMIAMDGKSITVLSDNLHLSDDSNILHLYKLLMRQKAMQKIQSDLANSNFGFSAIFTAGKEAQQQIRQHFLKFVEKCRALTEELPGDDVLQINFDLIPWSK